jgi:hypothetical protein
MPSWRQATPSVGYKAMVRIKATDPLGGLFGALDDESSEEQQDWDDHRDFQSFQVDFATWPIGGDGIDLLRRPCIRHIARSLTDDPPGEDC